jgi:hypothetical protein
MRTAAIVLMAAALLAAGGLRVRSYLASRGRGTLYLAVAANGAGLAVLLNAPGPYEWFDRVVFRHPDASALISHLLTVVGAGAAVEMVATLSSRAGRLQARLRVAATAIVGLVMVIAFVHGAPGPEQSLFFETYSGDPHLRIYWSVFFVSVIVQLSCIATLTLGYTRQTDRWLGRGLRLIGLGSVCAALFLASRLVEMALTRTAPAWNALSFGLLGLACVLLAGGVLLPQAGMATDRLVYRQRLHPLWTAVTEEFPIVRSNRTPVNLYRTVIEIQDALAEARSHHQVSTPALRALDSLPARPADQFEATVGDLLTVADALSLNPVPLRARAPW